MDKLPYTVFGGFAMALADSVPGVSGGTIAFIMGFYDKFIGALDTLVYGTLAEKKACADVPSQARRGLGGRDAACRDGACRGLYNRYI